jgi:polyisoprenoid-binding protein YceI
VSDHEHRHDHDHDHALITDHLPAGRWRVDDSSSEVLFRSRTLFGLVPVNGEFTRFSGELEVDQAGACSGRLIVQPESVSTGIKRRDAHLRSADFFDAGNHPEVTFTLEGLGPSGEDHLDVTGDLQLLHVTIPLAFTIYAIAHGDHLHIEGRALIDHEAAGLGWARAMVSGRARVDLALTLTRAGAGPSSVTQVG